MERMENFKINVSDSVLKDLEIRLKQTRWTDEPANAGWNYGTNPAYLRELVDYWLTKYNLHDDLTKWRGPNNFAIWYTK